MTMTINQEEIVDRMQVWAVKQDSSDGVDREVAFPEGEIEARRFQKSYGGQLWVRDMYVTAGHAVDEEPDENLIDSL